MKTTTNRAVPHSTVFMDPLVDWLISSELVEPVPLSPSVDDPVASEFSVDEASDPIETSVDDVSATEEEDVSLEVETSLVKNWKLQWRFPS